MPTQQNPTILGTATQPQPIPTHKLNLNPPDSTSIVYYMRQHGSDEFQWLKSVFGSKNLSINQFQQSTIPIVVQRRKELFQHNETPETSFISTSKSDTAQALVAAPDSTVHSIPNIGSDTTTRTDTHFVAAPDTLFTDSTTKSLVDQPKTKLIEELIILPKIEKSVTEAFISTTDLMLIVIILSFFVTTWLRVRFPQFMRQMTQSVLSYSESYKVYRESSLMARQFYAILGFVFTTNLALFLMQNIVYFKLAIPQIPDLALFGLIFVGVFVVYLLKRVALKTIGQLFMAYRVAEEYWFSVALINRAAGLLLFPFLIAIPYVPEYLQPYVVQASWLMLAVVFVFRILRGLRIAIEKHLSVFYMILYFCTLEILPVVLVVKFITAKVFGF